MEARQLPAADRSPCGHRVGPYDRVGVQGTNVGDLRKGPGHYLNTPFPGEPGNAAIAGHRTTFGAPFTASTT